MLSRDKRRFKALYSVFRTSACGKQTQAVFTLVNVKVFLALLMPVIPTLLTFLMFAWSLFIILGQLGS
jgi:hypothetical protein